MARATLDLDMALTLRIPAEIAEAACFVAGESIEVSGRRGEIVLRRAQPSALETLFAGKSPEEWRALYAGCNPWGSDVEREVVEP